MVFRLLIIAFAVLIVSPVQGGGQQNGIINFNVGSSPGDNGLRQQVTLYGCNNTKIETDVGWNTQNQVYGNVKYGYRYSKAKNGKSKKTYFIGKYYVASPPVFLTSNKSGPLYLGLATPDRFVLAGAKPAQIVNLDYEILEQIDIQGIPADFKYQPGDLPSCYAQKVTAVPINTSCSDLRWRNGAVGASGIGHMSDASGVNAKVVGAGVKQPAKQSETAFLPLRKSDGEPYQCNVDLLDDVVLSHEIYFMTGQGRSKTLNLTAVYEEMRKNRASSKEDKPIKLVCVPRENNHIPKGCRPKGD